jgi:indolepyruvate ferredoxin oxidoreductase, beta subunit
MNTNRPVSLLVCALGGEGGGVLTEWLVNVARQAGYAAQATSIPGVAQRTGATTYYIEVFPIPLADLGGKRPVFSLSPVPGALDAMVSSELLETVRQIGNGMTSPDRTLVISSSSRALTTQERMQLADGRADSAELVKVVRSFSREHHVFDMGAAAKEAGTVVSAAMLGAIAGSGIFPFTRDDYENVVREGGGASAQASLNGFAKGFESVCHPGLDPGSSDRVPFVDSTGLRVKPAMTSPEWPDPVREFASLGVQRMHEYQGAAYASLYEQRLRSVLAAEHEADPVGANGFAISREMARWLALWMAFDDIIRVADLKSRTERWDRVKREVKAKDEELLRVYDHFKPGAPEFAALLPSSLARRVLAWDKARVAKGKAPWAMPLKVGTHSVAGMLALRMLASLKVLRPGGSRYANEQAMIGKWLASVIDCTRRDWQLGHEIALCGRLIKGYGATNERGKESLLHVLDHLAHGADARAAARAIADARDAALADDAGKALDETLVRHGAPARPVKSQPIRFIRKMKHPLPRNQETT